MRRQSGASRHTYLCPIFCETVMYAWYRATIVFTLSLPTYMINNKDFLNYYFFYTIDFHIVANRLESSETFTDIYRGELSRTDW